MVAQVETNVAQPLIYAAMAKVKSEIGAVGKTRKNTQQGYSFRGIDDIYQACQLIMAHNGVFSIPYVVEQLREERKTKGGATWYWVCLTMEFTFYASDGSFVKARTVGEALDSGDKASNKAMSQAEKYALIESFKIPTHEARDTEFESPEPDAGKVQPAKPAERPACPPERPPSNGHAGVPINENNAVVEAAKVRWKPFLESITTPSAATQCIGEIEADLKGDAAKAVKRLLHYRAKDVLGFEFDMTAMAYKLPAPPPVNMDAVAAHFAQDGEHAPQEEPEPVY